MKTTILFFAIMLTTTAFGQDSTTVLKLDETRIFTVTPSAKVTYTAGINIGVMDDYQKQSISGLNMQLSPGFLFWFLIPKLPVIPQQENATVIVNGIHLSTGGMTNGDQLNGLGISAYHTARITNGVTFNLFSNNCETLNGIHASFLFNEVKQGNGILLAINNEGGNFNGLQIGLFNTTDKGSGIQLGISNKTKRQRGLQLGLINKTESTRGLQIGFWNKNSKRTLPFINF